MNKVHASNIHVSKLSVLFLVLCCTLTANAIEIMPYSKIYFSPVQDEEFSFSIGIDRPQDIEQLVVLMTTQDGDVVRALPIKDIGETIKIVWDGKDDNAILVPDEAYFPELLVTRNGQQEHIKPSANTGGQEVYDFPKSIKPGMIDYKLPVASRVLVRSGIKNGPMLRTIVDWQVRTAGLQVERWNGEDEQGLIALEKNPQVAYLVLGYQLPKHAIITYGNATTDFRAYAEKQSWPKLGKQKQKQLTRDQQVIRSEYYNSLLKQKSPRISVELMNEKKQPVNTVGAEEMVTVKVSIDANDEYYLDQDRYEISFFIDNEFIAEEEQGYVPFSWRIAPGKRGIKPGKRVLTVNVSAYTGQVGVFNLPFTLDAK